MNPRETRSQRQRVRYLQFKERVLADPEAREAFEEGLDELRLSARIATLRHKKGLTQKQIAAKAKTSSDVISRIERGHNVQASTLRRVAQALNVAFTQPPETSPLLDSRRAESSVRRDKLSIYIPQEKIAERPIQRLMKLGKKRDRSVNYLVVQALLQYLEREEKPRRRSSN